MFWLAYRAQRWVVKKYFMKEENLEVQATA
jgi:hypothetical protein